jgi:hypothetical protein
MQQPEQKFYRDGRFLYRDLGALTKADVQADHDIIVGYIDDDKMVIGNCFMANESEVMFNPLREYDWYKVALSRMVKLQETEEV